MFLNNGSSIDGRFYIIERSKVTGQVVGRFDEPNVITEQGINNLFVSLTLANADNSNVLKNFHLGNDYGAEEEPAGGWTVAEPRPANKTFSSLNQFVLYEVPQADMVVSYPTQNSIQYSTLLDGTVILDAYFPANDDLQYTSATLRFGNNTAFAYKRFPVRSLSRLIDVQVVWEFTWESSVDVVCPV